MTPPVTLKQRVDRLERRCEHNHKALTAITRVVTLQGRRLDVLEHTRGATPENPDTD